MHVLQVYSCRQVSRSRILVEFTVNLCALVVTKSMHHPEQGYGIVVLYPHFSTRFSPTRTRLLLYLILTTIAPPQTSDFFNERFMAARNEEGCYGQKKSLQILPCLQKDFRTKINIEVEMGTVFGEIRPGAGFRTGDFVEEKLGGLLP